MGRSSNEEINKQTALRELRWERKGWKEKQPEAAGQPERTMSSMKDLRTHQSKRERGGQCR